jgi:protein-S-isoprenylcysteine O-methyltransferase Ste14
MVARGPLAGPRLFRIEFDEGEGLAIAAWCLTMEPLRAPLLAIIPPPIIYAATFLFGWGVDHLGGSNPAWIRTETAHWLGLVLLIMGVAVSATCVRLFVSRRTTVRPAGRPARLVSNGAYARSRNPMYVCVTVIYAGAALALGQIWSLVLLPLPWAAANFVVIPFEEARLRETFGEAYDDYCRRVRRWL